MTVINDLATDQRVNRVMRLLEREGFDVLAIGRKLRNSPELTSGKTRVNRIRMVWLKGPGMYAFFNLRLLLKLLFTKKPDLLICNDLDTLPASFLASRLKHFPLLYDSHEFFTQVPELIDRKKVRWVWLQIESCLLPRLSHAITVSPSIARIYRHLYGTAFEVVRNMPEYQPKPAFEKERDERRAATRPMVIYQGALNMGRGLELLIDSMRYIADVDLVLAGTGDIHKELEQRVHSLGLEDRIQFRGRMMPEKLGPLTVRASLGISLEEDRGLNYRYALPNKVFDYIQARIPVLCSDLPEMRNIVENYQVGRTSSTRDPEQLAGIILDMLEEGRKGKYNLALERAAKELCWENESRIYLRILNRALEPSS